VGLIIKVNKPINIPDVTQEIKKLNLKVSSVVMLSGLVFVEEESEDSIEKISQLIDVVSVRKNTIIRDMVHASTEIKCAMSEKVDDG
jgi:calcineurin-like phosphoesterase